MMAKTVDVYFFGSVDKRHGCNGNFLAKGKHDFDAMLALATEHFPTVIERLIVPLREVVQ